MNKGDIVKLNGIEWHVLDVGKDTCTLIPLNLDEQAVIGDLILIDWNQYLIESIEPLNPPAVYLTTLYPANGDKESKYTYSGPRLHKGQFLFTEQFLEENRKRINDYMNKLPDKGQWWEPKEKV